jgi:hypothetical protein
MGRARRLPVAPHGLGQEFPVRRVLGIGIHPGEQHLEHETERVDVAGGGRRLPSRLLRAHEPGRTHDVADPGQIGFVGLRVEVRKRQWFRTQASGETEIQHLDRPVLEKHDVVGFQIAVDDAHGVGRRQRVGQLDGDGQTGIVGKVASRQPLFEGLAFQELQHDEVVAVVLDELQDPADSGVIELGKEPRLTTEAIARSRVHAPLLAQDLDRDPPVQRLVVAQPDLRHSTLAKGFHEPDVAHHAAALDHAGLPTTMVPVEGLSRARPAGRPGAGTAAASESDTATVPGRGHRTRVAPPAAHRIGHWWDSGAQWATRKIPHSKRFACLTTMDAVRCC